MCRIFVHLLAYVDNFVQWGGIGAGEARHEIVDMRKVFVHLIWCVENTCVSCLCRSTHPRVPLLRHALDNSPYPLFRVLKACHHQN